MPLPPAGKATITIERSRYVSMSMPTYGYPHSISLINYFSMSLWTDGAGDGNDDSDGDGDDG